MRIAVGSDHAGFPLKEKIVAYLREKGYDVLDLGTNSLDSVDYPVYGVKVGRAVTDGTAEKGIIVCGTGIGISIAANKVPGVRAANCTNEYMAKYTRLHNDANVLALGARVVGEGVAEEIVDVFLNTEFEGGRHARRVALLDHTDDL